MRFGHIFFALATSGYVLIGFGLEARWTIAELLARQLNGADQASARRPIHLTSMARRDLRVPQPA